MSNFLVRTEALVGVTGETTDMSDFLTAGAKWLIDLMPDDKALRTTTTATDSGSGVSVAGSRVFGAYKVGYKADFKEPEEYARYVDSASRFYGTSTTPIAYILNGTLFIKPGGGTARVIVYPTVAYTDSTIAGFPTEWEQAVVLFAAQQYAQSKFSNASLVYTNWVTYAETNKDIELGAEERAKLTLQLNEAQLNMQTAKILLDSLNQQLQSYLITLGIK